MRAEGFILTDEKGNERASMVTDGAGSVFLVLFDKNGRPRADLQVNNDGPEPELSMIPMPEDAVW